MKSIQTWLSEYGESHQNHTNKMIHWICVPSIFFSIVGLFYSIKLPVMLSSNLSLNVAMILLVLIVIYYASLSRTIWIGMLLFCMICLLLCRFIETHFTMPLWQISIIIFVLAWIGQFYGHKIEGKKPSFLKDLQFLLIGPAWLMSFIYGRLHISL
ncbi:Mpo1 family 2-hydroxy fatty acid dioxygenase [Taibaiella soli]|uniref:DUF962 domain-containing protein n=1 Tax=Taibaiella soli TaxID=1649169 RepID=A0A2W2AET2_9BACT|nr:Mpo1-like protein [Taibaiella soli]PZF72082.1 hypothetical protein DN068_14180 [Taibaiella soli]